MRLHLGPASDGSPEYRPGDPVQATVRSGGPQDGAYHVQTMRNLRTGRREAPGGQDGQRLATRQRTRSQDGSGDGPRRTRARVREHEPGTAGCDRGGNRGGGSRSGSGNSRGGGSRGGSGQGGGGGGRR
jgi:hypothetical protein